MSLLWLLSGFLQSTHNLPWISIAILVTRWIGNHPVFVNMLMENWCLYNNFLFVLLSFCLGVIVFVIVYMLCLRRRREPLLACVNVWDLQIYSQHEYVTLMRSIHCGVILLFFVSSKPREDVVGDKVIFSASTSLCLYIYFSLNNVLFVNIHITYGIAVLFIYVSGNLSLNISCLLIIKKKSQTILMHPIEAIKRNSRMYFKCK